MPLFSINPHDKKTFFFDLFDWNVKIQPYYLTSREEIIMNNETVTQE